MNCIYYHMPHSMNFLSVNFLYHDGEKVKACKVCDNGFDSEDENKKHNKKIIKKSHLKKRRDS